MHTRVDRNIELCGIFTIQFSELKSKKYNISFSHPDIKKVSLAQPRKFGYTVFVIFCFAIKDGAVVCRFGIKEAER